MKTRYDLKNIGVLLTKGFSESELRRFIFETPEFKDLHHKISDSDSLADIVQEILEFTERKQHFEQLLQLAREHNGGRYAEHQPYYLITETGIDTVLDVIQEILRNKEPEKTLQGRKQIIDSWDVASIKSCLHTQSEVVAQEAFDQAKSDESDLLSGLISLTVDLRWKRAYASFLEDLFDNWDSSKNEESGSLIDVLLQNREALLPLLARWKLPGAEWLLPDEEEFRCKVGESLLGNSVPDHNSLSNFIQLEVELSQEKEVIEEIFVAKRSMHGQLDPALDDEKENEDLIGKLPEELRGVLRELGIR